MAFVLYNRGTNFIVPEIFKENNYPNITRYVDVLMIKINDPLKSPILENKLNF